MEWILARWLTYAALALLAGAACVGTLLAPRTADDDTLPRDCARLAVGAVLALLPASLLRLVDQLSALQSPGDAPWTGLGALLFSTTWGTGFTAQLALHGAAAASAWSAARAPRSRAAWGALVASALALCATPSLQGHAIAAEGKEWWAVASDVLHVIGASAWLGTIATVAWTTLAVRGDDVRADDPAFAAERARRDARLLALVAIVPPVALAGAATLVASGVSASLVHLTAPRDLWASEWGRYLAVKTALAAIVLALGALNWRRLVPRAVASRDPRALRRAIGAELAVAALVLLVTALLVVTPPPGE